jgi:hypothetical protein
VVPFGPSPPSSSGGGVSSVTPRDLFHSPNRGGEEEEERGDTPAAVVPRGRALVTQTARSPMPAEAKNQHLKQWANKRKSLSGASTSADVPRTIADAKCERSLNECGRSPNECKR